MERQLRINIFRWIGVKLYYEPLFKSQCVSVGKNFSIIRGRLQGIPYIAGKPYIEIGSNVTFHSVITIAGNKIFDRPALKVGDNVYIGSRVSISIAKEVKIGNNCYIANNIIIRDNDGHPKNWLMRRQNMPVLEKDVKPVWIGDDVWIGSNSVILKGCTIGNGAIIASGSIVTKNVEPFTIVAGNPAKLVKKLDES
jgi:acetyltransferase-like isoleucine patch superfamily enzyme